MRVRPLVFAAILAMGAAWTANAQTDDGEVALGHFQSQLAEQCPQKQLTMLSARDLRDGLDDYMASLSDDDRGKLQDAERAHCSDADSSGAACVNMADLSEADQIGRMDDLARWVCGAFLRCRDQNVCDYAR
jgi:hypothetical protein